MTTIRITLPDSLAQEAERAGLLAPARVERWLREQIETTRVDALFTAMDRAEATHDGPIVTPEEIAVEIAAMRAERATSHGTR